MNIFRFLNSTISLLLAFACVVNTSIVNANINQPACDNNQTLCMPKSIAQDAHEQQSPIKLEIVKTKQQSARTCDVYAHKTKNDAHLNAMVESLGSCQLVTRMMYATLPDSLVYEMSDSDTEVDYDAMSEADLKKCELSQVPVPAATWLLVSALIGFIGMSNRR